MKPVRSNPACSLPDVVSHPDSAGSSRTRDKPRSTGMPPALASTIGTSVRTRSGVISAPGSFRHSRFGFKAAAVMVVGGFMTRMVLLFGISAAVVAATGADPAAFVMWLVSFYFALILVEAWILARQPLENAE